MLPNPKSTSSMPLRASERKQQQRLKLQKQAKFRSTILLILIIVVSLLDLTLLKSGLLYSKGITLGAVLNWFSHTIFVWFVFRYTGAKARRAVVNQLYLGQLIKWLVIMIGFSLIFTLIKPISAGAVITGFIGMQIGHFISLWLVRL